MNKQELKEKVRTMSETISNVDGKGEYVGISKNAVLSLIDQLGKSELKETQLVEIPQFVDDWIRGIKSGEISESGTGEEDLIFEICQQYYEETLPEELSKWFSHNVDSYIFYRAVLDGYTISPPKTLQVIVKKYDSAVYKTELPEDEAMKLIEGWKG